MLIRAFSFSILTMNVYCDDAAWTRPVERVG